MDPAARVLINAQTFVIECGKDGFNVYRQTDEAMKLVAASSSVSTYMKVMADILEAGTGKRAEFQIKE